MRKWLKRLLWLVLVLYVILMAVGIYLYFNSRTSMEGTLTLKGLHGKVSITRDQYGVPHIVAEKSDLDAFFALGYVHAQDRFWQMEMNRRIAQGTLSEVFGESTVKADEYLRTWGFYNAAFASWKSLSPDTQAMIQSYTDGVNAFIAQNHLPLQFRLLNFKPKPWTVIDSTSWQKVLAWDLQDVWKAKVKNYLVEKNLGKDKISELFPEYPATSPLVLSDEDLKQSGLLDSHFRGNDIGKTFASAPDKGSNAWVVSGKLTTTGKPLLANDPHLELQAPALWYLAELKGPRLHVTGATMPGIPMVAIGHNDFIAWGVTNVNPDTQELYILPGSARLSISTETIKVHNKPNVLFPIIHSDVGPVISYVTEAKAIGSYVAIKWTALQDNDTTLQSMAEIDYAKNWTEFVEALKDFVVPSQNFVYADKEGNIGYYLPGKIPLRDWDNSLPVLDDPKHQWKGFIPFEKLPHVLNPPEGYIITANNKVVSDHYPYRLSLRWYVPPYRAERIHALLKENLPATVDKFKTMQADTVSLLWLSLAPQLLETKPLDGNSKLALNYLKSWNGEGSLKSIPQTIFAYWYQQLRGLTPEFLLPLMTWPEPLYIQNQLSKYPEFLSQSLEKAMKQLIKDRGNQPTDWQWGKVHHAYFSEMGIGGIPGLGLIWNREIPSPGSLYTVNAGTYEMNSFRQNNGPGYRQIMDLSDWNNSLYIQSMGQSNNIFNNHYQDLMTLWRDGKYIPMKSQSQKGEKTQTLVLTPQ